MRIFINSLLIVFTAVMFANAQEKKIDLPFYNWKLKEGKGKDKFEMNCLMCHSPGYVFNIAKGQNKSSDMWEHIVEHMINDFKAPISEEDAKQIDEYLEEYYSN